MAFKSISSVAKPGAVFYLKHRPFFSYLGGHRYASIGIPWGHVLLTDDELRRFVKEYHPERSEEMIEFFFHGLAYPRYSVADMLRIAQVNGFVPLGIQYEPPLYIAKTALFINEVDNFWDIVWSNYPRVSTDELMSGIVHIVLKKAY